MKRFLLVFSGTLALLGFGLLIVARCRMPVSVSVGDHKVRMSVTGHGSPSVVCETFGVGYLETWSKIQPEIARFAKVVSYDHAGYWGSEPGQKPRDAKQIAHELHEALCNAGVSPPYLLVGYSFGGPYIRVFASMYPEEVCGMVFVDPAQEQFSAWLKQHFPGMNVVSDEDRQRQDEWGSQETSFEQARLAQLPPVPITLISAAQPGGILLNRWLPEWLKSHRDWLSQYPHARHIITTNSGHGIFFTEPNLVVDAVREMYELKLVRTEK
jgi:pimeloyl-ACP methyl ester carboxylesterase